MTKFIKSKKTTIIILATNEEQSLKKTVSIIYKNNKKDIEKFIIITPNFVSKICVEIIIFYIVSLVSRKDIKIQNNLPQPYPCEELPLNSSLVQYQPCPAADRLETQRKERTAKKSFRLV